MVTQEQTRSTLLSDTLKPNGLVETSTRPGVLLCNKPMDLSVCVSEERGHEEGGGAHATVRYTKAKWLHRARDCHRSGVWLSNKPMDLSVCVSEERGHEEGGGVYATLLSNTLKPNGRTGTVTRSGK